MKWFSKIKPKLHTPIGIETKIFVLTLLNNRKQNKIINTPEINNDIIDVLDKGSQQALKQALPDKTKS